MPAAIPATNPTVLPAIPERVYPLWLIAEVLFTGTGLPDDPVQGQVRFRQYRELPEGGIELAPSGTEAILTEPDIAALAATDPAVANALGIFRAAVVARAHQKGLL